MFEKFMSFLGGLGDTAKAASANPEQLAAAALMFAVMDADGVRHEAERETLRDLLEETYHLGDSSLDKLVIEAEAAEAESVDLYQFTSSIVKLSEEQRLHFIELLWEVVFADGELHEMEDNVVWRIAELIGVSPRERIEARRRVAAEAHVPELTVRD